MEDAILTLQIAVKDEERSVSAHWKTLSEIEKNIEALDNDYAKAHDRYVGAISRLEGLKRGLEALKAIAE